MSFDKLRTSGKETRRSRAHRGAAMAEMVILAPLMIALWIGIDFFRQGYVRRLQAIADADGRAWKLAMSNDLSCYKGGSETLSQVSTAASNNSGVAGQAVSTFQANSGSSSLFMYGHADITATREISRHGALKGGSVKAGTYVICNEVVPATNANAASGAPYEETADQDVLSPVVSFIKSLF